MNNTDEGMVTESPPPQTNTNETVTFQDLGINVFHNTRRTFLGNVQTCSSLKPIELTFLIFSIVSFVISLGLTIDRLITLDINSPDFTFAILLLLTTAFCLYYAFDGIFLERPYEIFVCVISTIIVIVYCILNYAYSIHEVLKLVRLIGALVLGSVVIGTGCIIAVDFHKSGDLIYRTVGANIELQRCCNVLFAVSSLLGLDLQLEASMLIFVMRNGVSLGLLEQIVLGVGVPFSILWLILGCFSMRRESKGLSGIFLSLAWAEPAYIIYKFLSLDEIKAPILRYSIIACGTCALIVRISLIIYFAFAIRNYRKGLREKIFGNGVHSTTRSQT